MNHLGSYLPEYNGKPFFIPLKSAKMKALLPITLKKSQRKNKNSLNDFTVWQLKWKFAAAVAKECKF